MNDWLKQKELIEEEIQQKLSYPYLRRFIEHPVIEDFRLISLMLPFALSDLKESKAKQYITTATLIQIALDTHEKVTVYSSDIEKKQQLTVLAGDYFSGLYYQILAELNDLPMIRSLAESVKRINENKIALYQQEHQTIEALMMSVYKIETEIINKFYSFFDYQHVSPAISNVLYVNRLLKEKQQFLSGGTSLLFNALKKLQFPKVKNQLSKEQMQVLARICDQYADHAKHSIEAVINKDAAQSFITTRLRQILANEFFGNKTYVEEG
ncbi:heptaprenyl diphosphate synthase [Bacillus ectoiniformans]|uniref:heptaprenyl diphosphate synthase component 1 n=1 Tax=Bacillus ectoiniformans TaxID=1494429 RepID=UPI00195C4BE5|nr:heptaprenyl diphosphate synthase component 1 [Bacillus ectoiniformans]MBM7647996.1 heptaprenyl diphosphate synthase [Bacillus ectoiniformans]